MGFLIVIVLAFTGCVPAGFTGMENLSARTESRVVHQDQTPQICAAIEGAGYIMPYGETLGWYTFDIVQTYWILEGTDGPLLEVPRGNPRLYIMVDWSVPADMNTLPDAVSQETVDMLAEEAKNICRIVQDEAQKSGIGPVDVRIRLWDLWVGFELEYGAGPYLNSTSDCDQLVGAYISKSVGLNPQGRTEGQCPSLYTPY